MSRLLRVGRSALGLDTAAALTTGLLAPLGAQAAPVSGTASGPAAVAAPAVEGWTPRPEQWSETVTTTNHALVMSDGTTLYGDLTRPARADGTPVRGWRAPTRRTWSSGATRS